MSDNKLYTLTDFLPGLLESDILFVASDVTILALNSKREGIRFDSNLFIDSFQNHLKRGTLIFPAYTDNLKNGDLFDMNKSRPTTGALSNKVMRRKDFIRSKDPLHSVFSWGAESKEISQISSNSSLGKGSVFDFLYFKKAKMICIDVDFQDSLTFVHYVEEKLNVNYRKEYKFNLDVVDNNEVSTKKFVSFHTKKPWVLTSLDSFQQASIDKGITKVISYSGSTILYFELEQMHDFIVDYIKSGKKLYKISILAFLKVVIKRILKRE